MAILMVNTSTADVCTLALTIRRCRYGWQHFDLVIHGDLER